jgi:hypothetical protein
MVTPLGRKRGKPGSVNPKSEDYATCPLMRQQKLTNGKGLAYERPANFIAAYGVPDEIPGSARQQSVAYLSSSFA